jgi:tetratricopeptide (TPR) repeat protein
LVATVAVAFLAVVLAPLRVGAQNSAAQGHASQGISLIKEGKLAEAEGELRAAVRAAPTVAIYRAQLGSVLGLEGKWKEALASFQKAVDLAPEDIKFRRETAAVQWQLGLMAPAEKNLQVVLTKQPNDAGSLLLLGLVKEKTGDYAAAAQLLDSQFGLVISNPERSVALFNASIRSGQRAQLAKVTETLKQRANDPAWAHALNQCTQIAAVVGDIETAGQLFSLLPAGDPARPAAGLQLAKGLYRHGNVSATKQLLLQLAEQGVKSGDLLALLGACYEAEHQPTLAQEAYRQEIALDPSRIDYYNDLISLLLDMGKTSDATAVINRALAVAPKDARPWVWKGHVNLQANAYQDAIESYNHAGQLDRSNVDAILGVASVHFILGQNDAAIAAYKKGITLFPNDARLYTGWAVTLLASPDSRKLQPEAKALLEKAVKVAPRSAEAHYQLGQLALQQDRLKDAERELSVCVQLEPHQSKAHFALASVYRRMKRTDDAAKEFAMYQDLKEKEEGTKRAIVTGAKP